MSQVDDETSQAQPETKPVRQALGTSPFSIDADAYLDARRPEWLEAESRGDVQCRNARVLIDRARTDILSVLSDVTSSPVNPFAIPVRDAESSVSR